MTATITYLTDSGVEKNFTHEVPAHSRRTVLVNAEMPDETGVAAIVQGQVGLICERSVYFNHNGIDGGHQAIGINALRPTSSSPRALPAPRAAPSTSGSWCSTRTPPPPTCT